MPKLITKKTLTSLKNPVIVGLHMFRKFVLVSAWFAAAPTLIAVLVLSVYQLSRDSHTQKNPQVIAEDYGSQNLLEGQVIGVRVDDMRPHKLAQFLEGTRLAPYSDYIVETSDKYGIDYKLIPAIAMKESQGGNAIIESTHNAWGWENGSTNFDSWEQAIDTVARTLKRNYIDKGLVTPEQIMAVYAPPQLLTGGKWAIDINHFYEKIENL